MCAQGNITSPIVICFLDLKKNIGRIEVIVKKMSLQCQIT